MDEIERVYEQVLALRCQAGDAAAFAELVRTYHPRLLLYVRKMLGRERVTVADDVAQEIWLDAHRGLHGLREVGALRAWLYRIAHARTCRVLRRREPPTVSLDHAAEVADEGSGGAFAAEDAEAIHAALDALSFEHREVLLLRFVEQMSYEQIGLVTGREVGTVRSRLHYAKRALRDKMERNYHA